MGALKADSRNGYEYQPVPSDEREIHLQKSLNSEQSAKVRYYSSADMRTPWVCGVGYEVRTVSAVDCVTETYFADVSIFLHWFDNDNKRLPPGEVDGSSLSNAPTVLISNGVSVEERLRRCMRLSSDPPGVLRCECIYTGVFREFMELENFPLDDQDLTISLRFVDTRWIVKSIRDSKFSSIDGVELAEWLMFEPRTQTGQGSLGYPTWELKMKILRKHQYYLSNVIGMMGGLASLVFFSFLFSPENWASRSAFCATLLLTSVAFKLVVDGSLPKVSFTTILDLYMSVAFCTMMSVVIEAATVKFLQRVVRLTHDQLLRLDAMLGILMVCSWFIWNAIYILRFFQFQRAQTDALGNLLSQVVTNKPSNERCVSFLCCIDGEDTDKDVEAPRSPGSARSPRQRGGSPSDEICQDSGTCRRKEGQQFELVG
jgi:hypothetical protein